MLGPRGTLNINDNFILEGVEEQEALIHCGINDEVADRPTDIWEGRLTDRPGKISVQNVGSLKRAEDVSRMPRSYYFTTGDQGARENGTAPVVYLSESTYGIESFVTESYDDIRWILLQLGAERLTARVDVRYRWKRMLGIKRVDRVRDEALISTNTEFGKQAPE